MRLLIDGYNLLHATDLFAADVAPGTGPTTQSTPLARSRGALLQFLAVAIDDRLRPRTTIIFDARDAPPGLPSTGVESDMTVRFARQRSADAMIEDLIEQHTAPRELLVVSSDHRLHRAARMRGATAIDSDVWYRKAIAALREAPRVDRDRKPPPPSSPGEIQKWLDEFAD